MAKNNNNLWYILGGVVIVVLVLWVVIANLGDNKVVCNYPYIQVGESCCLDENSNNICDNDELSQQNTNTNQQGSSNNNEPTCYEQQVPYQEEECSMKDTSDYVIEIKEENIHLVDGQIGVNIHVKHSYSKVFFSIDYQVFCDGDYNSGPTFTDTFATEWQPEEYDGSFFIGDKFDASIIDLTNCYIEVINAEYRDCQMVTKYRTETICN